MLIPYLHHCGLCCPNRPNTPTHSPMCTWVVPCTGTMVKDGRNPYVGSAVFPDAKGMGLPSPLSPIPRALSP
jgi:hypothetical protein